MNITVMDTLVTVGSLVLMALGVFALYELIKLIRSLRAVVKHTDEELVPLLQELRVAVNRVNQELGRIDEIVRTVQEIGEKVNVTAQLAQKVVSSPLIKVASYSTGTKEAVKKLFRR